MLFVGIPDRCNVYRGWARHLRVSSSHIPHRLLGWQAGSAQTRTYDVGRKSEVRSTDSSFGTAHIVNSPPWGNWLYGDSTRVWPRDVPTAMASGGTGKTMNGLPNGASGGGTIGAHQWSGASGASLGWLVDQMDGRACLTAPRPRIPIDLRCRFGLTLRRNQGSMVAGQKFLVPFYGPVCLCLSCTDKAAKWGREGRFRGWPGVVWNEA